MGQAADELRDADEIREDIERTRDDMAVTLDAVGEKISPRLQAERQMDQLRQRGIEPKALAMAVGFVMLGLLLIRRRRGSGES